MKRTHGVGTLIIMAMLFWLWTSTSGWSQCPPGRQCPAQRAHVQHVKPGAHVQRHRVHRVRHWRPFRGWVRNRGFKRALWGG